MTAAGRGVAPDPAAAARWYRKAAEQGYEPAENSLAALYQAGTGVPQDSTEAVRWYRRAADRGSAVAQNNLGVLYAQGKGVAPDLAEAYFWFSLAAAPAGSGQGNAAANRDALASGLSANQIA